MYDRSTTIGASDAVHIMAGEWQELYDRKTGPDDRFEWNLAAEIGKATEDLNIIWFIKKSGFENVYHDRRWKDEPFIDITDWHYTYTPDALIRPRGKARPTAIVEAKAVNLFWKPHNLIDKYMPQLQHGMRVMRVQQAFLSVIYLNIKYEYYEIAYDPMYDDRLKQMEAAFLWHLLNGVRP